MATRTHPDDYYEILKRVLELMADQAGKKPFDTANFRRQFRKAAIEHGCYPGADGYLPRFTTVLRWVKRRLPNMTSTTSPAPAIKPLVPAPTPQAWRDPNAFDARLAQLPPSDRD